MMEFIYIFFALIAAAVIIRSGIFDRIVIGLIYCVATVGVIFLGFAFLTLLIMKVHFYLHN